MPTNLDAMCEDGAFRPVGEVTLPWRTARAFGLTAQATQEAEAASPQPKLNNGLAALAGGWTDQQWKDFEASVAVAEHVDEAFWQ